MLFALKQNFLSGEIVINLDSEDDGEVFVGCAGGIDTVAKLSYKTEKTPEHYFGFTVTVTVKAAPTQLPVVGVTV